MESHGFSPSYSAFLHHSLLTHRPLFYIPPHTQHTNYRSILLFPHIIQIDCLSHLLPHHLQSPPIVDWLFPFVLDCLLLFTNESLFHFPHKYPLPMNQLVFISFSTIWVIVIPTTCPSTGKPPHIVVLGHFLPSCSHFNSVYMFPKLLVNQSHLPHGTVAIYSTSCASSVALMVIIQPPWSWLLWHFWAYVSQTWPRITCLDLGSAKMTGMELLQSWPKMGMDSAIFIKSDELSLAVINFQSACFNLTSDLSSHRTNVKSTINDHWEFVDTHSSENFGKALWYLNSGYPAWSFGPEQVEMWAILKFVGVARVLQATWLSLGTDIILTIGSSLMVNSQVSLSWKVRIVWLSCLFAKISQLPESSASACFRGTVRDLVVFNVVISQGCTMASCLLNATTFI